MKALVNLLFPKFCVVCHTILHSSQEHFCVSCMHNLPRTHWFLDTQNEIYDKLSSLFSVHAATSVFRLNDVSTRFIHQLKYKNQQSYGTLFAEMLLPYLTDSHELQAVIPVPIHDHKLKIRGYNQNYIFGKTLSDKLDIPFMEKALKRTVHQQSQTFSGRKKRIERLQNTFTIGEVNDTLSHILLVDDVCTTGSTLYHCATALQQQYDCKVSVATMVLA